MTIPKVKPSRICTHFGYLFPILKNTCTILDTKNVIHTVQVLVIITYLSLEYDTLITKNKKINQPILSILDMLFLFNPFF